MRTHVVIELPQLCRSDVLFDHLITCGQNLLIVPRAFTGIATNIQHSECDLLRRGFKMGPSVAASTVQPYKRHDLDTEQRQL